MLTIPNPPSVRLCAAEPSWESPLTHVPTALTKLTTLHVDRLDVTPEGTFQLGGMPRLRRLSVANIR